MFYREAIGNTPACSEATSTKPPMLESFVQVESPKHSGLTEAVPYYEMRGLGPSWTCPG